MNKDKLLPLIKYILAVLLGAVSGYAAGPTTAPSIPAAPAVGRCVDVLPLPAPVALSADATTSRD